MKFIPRRHKGSSPQVAAYDQAVRDLWANSEREKRAGIRHETEEFHRLNDRVGELARPLSPLQRSYLMTGARIDRAESAERRGRSR